MQTTTNGVKHTVTASAISLDKIYKADYQKPGTMTAQLRQTVTTVSEYPSKKVDNNLQANIFDAEDFGFEMQEFTSTEERVAWIPVPEKTTAKDLKAKLELANKAGAVIYRVLGNQPILSDDQKYAINQGLRTTDDFAATQAVRYPEGTTDKAGVDVSGKLVLDKAGNVQYRRTFFWLTPMEDKDVRGTATPYVSPELAKELAGEDVMQGQSL